MKCKFCGNESTLIKAHIIPAGFFRRLQQGKEALELITNTAGEYKKRSQVGVYDRTIVCSNCEAIWQEWDKYVQHLLVEKPLNGRVLYRGNQEIGYIVDNFEYSKLKLFFISMVWRASVSSHKYFNKISLGEFEDIAKQNILNNDPGDSENFRIVLSKFNHPLANVILDPYIYKNSGVNYSRFYLGSYMADIKVDHKPSPMLFSKFAIAENRPLHIVYRDFTRSKELNLMKKLIEYNQQTKPLH